MERQRVTESHKGVGKARIGGGFTLTNQNGERLTDKEARDGKFSLVRMFWHTLGAGIINMLIDPSGDIGILRFHSLPGYMS